MDGGIDGWRNGWIDEMGVYEALLQNENAKKIIFAIIDNTKKKFIIFFYIWQINI